MMLSSFILYGTAFVHSLEMSIGVFEIASESTFVAKTPDND